MFVLNATILVPDAVSSEMLPFDTSSSETEAVTAQYAYMGITGAPTINLPATIYSCSTTVSPGAVVTPRSVLFSRVDQIVVLTLTIRVRSKCQRPSAP